MSFPPHLLLLPMYVRKFLGHSGGAITAGILVRAFHLRGNGLLPVPLGGSDPSVWEPLI